MVFLQQPFRPMGLNPAVTGMSLILRMFFGRGDIMYIVSACKYNEQMLKIKIIVPLFTLKIHLLINSHAEWHIIWKPLFCKIQNSAYVRRRNPIPRKCLSYTNSHQSTPPLFLFPSFFKGRGFPSSSRFSSSSLFTASSFPVWGMYRGLASQPTTAAGTARQGACHGAGRLHPKQERELTAYLQKWTERACRWFPPFSDAMCLEKFYRSAGFTPEQTDRLFTFQPLEYSGNLYFEEHKRSLSVTDITAQMGNALPIDMVIHISPIILVRTRPSSDYIREFYGWLFLCFLRQWTLKNGSDKTHPHP